MEKCLMYTRPQIYKILHEQLQKRPDLNINEFTPSDKLCDYLVKGLKQDFNEDNDLKLFIEDAAKQLHDEFKPTLSTTYQVWQDGEIRVLNMKKSSPFDHSNIIRHGVNRQNYVFPYKWWPQLPNKGDYNNSYLEVKKLSDAALISNMIYELAEGK